MGDRRSSPIAAVGTSLGSLGRKVGGPVFQAATAPPVAKTGAAIATQAARLWGRILGGKERKVGDLTVVTGLPPWAFGRGGTTIGSTYLTRDSDSAEVLEHEEVHRQQWERYGLWFIPMYFSSGVEATKNRFEIEAGLEKGGYLPKPGQR